jgi:uncharacterized protein YndB with AHSA1/START domain
MAEPEEAERSEPDLEAVTTRDLAASPAAVLAAWTDPTRLARWWGPAGFRNTFEQCDPRPGGRWRFVMHGPNGASYRNESAFVEVGPAQVVVDHLSAPRFRLTVTLEARGGGTRLTWRQAFSTAAEAKALRALVTVANEQNLDRLVVEVAAGR